MSERSVQAVCPTCNKPGDWFAGKHGPFCPHRCKLVDPGKWPGGEPVISEPLRPGHFEPYGVLSPGAALDRPEKE